MFLLARPFWNSLPSKFCCYIMRASEGDVKMNLDILGVHFMTLARNRLCFWECPAKRLYETFIFKALQKPNTLWA